MEQEMIKKFLMEREMIKKILSEPLSRLRLSREEMKEMVDKILSEELPREGFKWVILELPVKEQKILNMALGLENKAPQSLEKICKKFRITKTKYQYILKKALKKYIEEREKPVGAKPGWRYSFLAPHDFSNFRELKDFVWRLFEKGYSIDKVEYTRLIDLPSHLSYLAFRREMWICHKKARKCYIFTFITDQDNKLFDLIYDLFFLYQKTKKNKNS